MANSNIIELCILSDATLSMGPYIKQVKEDIGKIIGESRCQFGIDAFRVAFVAYRDWIGDGERLETLPFTTNIPLFEKFVSNLKEEGGDDAAEDVLGGLQTAINLKWTAPIKILYHICDAPPHGTMYHDLFDTKTQQIDSMLSTINRMMSMEDDNDNDGDGDDNKDESSDDDDDDMDDYNDLFFQSKIQYKLSENERIKLDRYPNKHVNDADHNDLLKLIKNKGIEYCIGAKTSHVDKFIKIMIVDGNKIDLKVNQMEIPDITALFPSVLRSIEYALRISSKKNKNAAAPKVYRPLKINRKGNFKVHCGIDFGTDGSAISLLNPQTKKVLIHQWGSNKQNTKTKTNILISPKDGKLLAFGSDAADRYSNISENAAESSSDDDADDDDNNGKSNNAPMFFEHFKMLLYKHSSHINPVQNKDNKDNKEDDNYNEEDKKDDSKYDIAESIRAVGGRRYSSSKILIAALKFMKDKVMSIVKEKPYFIKDIDEIQWILSVPAIWSDKAKYIMERCAENAGMINKQKNIENHLLIAYEPDCASISIRNSYSDISARYNKKNKTHGCIFNVSDRYLLLDLGGGTADIATHEIVDAYHVKQIRAPSGGPWGSSYIDKEFEKLLRKIFKAKWIDNFEKKYPDKYVHLLRSFRFRKERFRFGIDVDSRRFDDNFYRNNMEIFTMNSMAFIQYASQNKTKKERKFHEVSLSFQFVEEIGKCIEKDTQRVLKGINNHNDDDSDSDNDMDDHEWIQLYLENFKLFGEFAHLIKSDKEVLYFEESIFRYLFDVIIDKIIEHCKYLLSQIKDIKYICLVGGFSESKYLQSKIFYEFGPSSRFKIKILTPKKPILCVVDGAARYGLRPDYITSRTVSKTYGLSIQKSLYQFMKSYPNIKIKDDQIITIDNNQWVNNCFLPFVRKNDVIRLDDEPKVFYFEPSDKNADKIIIKLYESDEINPVFTDDDGKNSKLCAKKEYILPKGWQKENDSIPVKFFFGDSTIRVFVDLQCINNDNEKEIRLDFNTSINAL